MKEQIRQRAIELGFDACRFTTAEPPVYSRQFQQWIAQGQHGEMSYLARNLSKRANPDLVLSGAKSIISLATSYATAEEKQSAQAGEKQSTELPAGSGVIARYARFSDYHNVLGDKLKELVEFVDRLSAAGSLWYVDTGPLLERDLAQRAGLGFIGKHTNLISRSLGNWLFLSEIITTAEIEPDPPEQNHCGSCTQCLEACPTGAITAPFQLDARRCISYLTIELKGSIPLEFRRAIGNRIYGCDDCLQVCPWNRFAREGSLMKGQARPDVGQMELLELLSLDDAGFKQRFAGTPIVRTKRRGLLRNVCVALGNIGNASVLPALTGASADPEPLIAEHAKWAIDEIRARLNKAQARLTAVAGHA